MKKMSIEKQERLKRLTDEAGIISALAIDQRDRNEKLLQVLEEELESDQRKVIQVSEVEVNEEVPWERPIFPKKESKEKGEDFVDEKRVRLREHRQIILGK